MNTTRAEALQPTLGGSRTGFRPSSRSRIRIAIGTLLSLTAVGVVLLVFSTADRRVPVLQVVRDLPAGTQISASDVRSIELSTDPSLAVVDSADIASVVGRYTRVRVVTGGLLAANLLQFGPLVAPGSAVVAVTVPAGELPAGLRERSRVQLVMPVAGDVSAITPIIGRVVGLPAAPDSVTGQVSVSFEVSPIDAVAAARAATVRVVLLDPGTDTAGVEP
ncbi:MAG: SAF domain-containing protein [Ilumatobacteraceae bacterium]